MASIMAYLDANPSAADTLDGIHDAWLGGAAPREAVEEAVEELVERELVTPRSLPDGSVLFARAAHRAS
jgi:hypothetical protein